MSLLSSLSKFYSPLLKFFETFSSIWGPKILCATTVHFVRRNLKSHVPLLLEKHDVYKPEIWSVTFKEQCSAVKSSILLSTNLVSLLTLLNCNSCRCPERMTLIFFVFCKSVFILDHIIVPLIALCSISEELYRHYLQVSKATAITLVF
jgi:hypothetical protein